MYTYFVRLCAIILIVGSAGVKAEVVVEKKGYRNILVSFSPTVPKENGRNVIEDMQNVLTEASGVLSTAIGLRISQVTFLIPNSWDTSKWENISIDNPSLTPEISAADILVDGTTDNAFGKRPFALQYGGCGVPGSKISIPAEFLTEEPSYPKGKIIAREWLKYRYGVFDENGFPDDKMYPVYYKVPGSQSTDVEINDCTNIPLEYNFKDVNGSDCTLKINELTGFPTNENDGCLIKPNEQSAKNVTSSLMYFKNELPELEHICGSTKNPHNKLAPSKHNTLCQGKSIWEVVQRSSDFRSDTEVDSEDEGEIEFSYIQEGKPRVVIACENTIKLSKNKNVILKTIRKFLYGLPDGSKYAFYPYQDEKKDKISLETLKDWPGNRDATANFLLPKEACTTCAISKAIDAFVQDSGAQDESQETGFIIIVTATDSSVDEELMKRIENSQLCPIVFAFTDQTENLGQLVNSSSCGSIWNATTDSEDKILFEKMSDAFESVLPRITDNAVTKTIKTDYLQHGTDMEIPVDGTIANVTLWITHEKLENELITCKTNEKAIEMNQVFDSNAFTVLYYNPEKKEDLFCSFKYDTVSKTLTQVLVTSKPGEYFESQVWIKDTTEKDDEHQMPVIIYANLNFGPYPVKNAEVKATVTLPDGTEKPLDLFDDGRGDPDITEGDGTYSRYFIDFTSKGQYTVTIEATDNGRQAKASKKALQQCCGSSIRTGDDIQLGEFKEVFQNTFLAKSEKPQSGYRPSRITDLRIVDSNVSSVVLEWTAPGGEADTGKASSYEIRIFCDEDCPRELQSIIDKPTPAPYASKQQAKVTFQNFTKNQIIYFGIEGVNDKNQKSDMSNIVSFIKTQGDWQEITTPKPNTKDKELKYSSTGIIIGCSITAILVVICLAIAAYFCRRKSKSKQNPNLNEIENNSSNRTEKSPSLGTIKNKINGSSIRRVESFPVLLYTHNQIKDFKRKTKDPPLYKADIAPKPWMSLDMLPRNKSKLDNDNRSLGSSSTIHINDQETSASKEMKQVDNISRDSDFQSEKIAKF